MKVNFSLHLSSPFNIFAVILSQRFIVACNKAGNSNGCYAWNFTSINSFQEFRIVCMSQLVSSSIVNFKVSSHVKVKPLFLKQVEISYSQDRRHPKRKNYHDPSSRIPSRMRNTMIRKSSQPRYNEPYITSDLVIVKRMKRTSNTRRSRYSEQILPVPWPFAISRFHSYCELSRHHDLINKPARVKLEPPCTMTLH